MKLSVNINKSLDFIVLFKDSFNSGRLMFLESKVRPIRKADNLAAICEPVV
jgi:hypothetical protein